MQTDGNPPSTADIRQVLLNSFSDDELTALCFDYFRDVYDVFSTGPTREHKVQLLIEHCVRRELIPNLLAAIQRSQAEQHPVRPSSVRPAPAEYERDPKQIFISHAHEDARFAHRLAEDLQKNGWRAWIAPESIRPGEKWVEAINRGLDESGVFALVLTPKAVQSTWVMHETNVAIEYEHEGHLRFIPLDVEPCSAPPLWRVYQRVPFLGRYQDGLNSLLTELGATDAFGTTDKRIHPPPLSVPVPPESISASQPAKPPSVYPLKNPLPFLLGGVGVVLLIIVAVLISRIPAAAPVPPTQRPIVTSIIDATPTPTAMQPTNTPVPVTLTPTNTPLPPSPTLKPTATPAPGTARVSDKDGMVMVYVPAGEFLMGSADSDKDAESDEKPQHKVYLDAFWIDRTEVTNAQYNKCVQAGACTASGFASHYKYNADNQPVGDMEWNSARAYCQWVGRQLPTEAQWEKAARGTDGRIYPWGDQAATCEYAVMDDGSGQGCGKEIVTWPVGSKPEGASPYGALDMAGNVEEWVADWYDEKYYTDRPFENPLGPSSGRYRVVRSSAWHLNKIYVRAASRLYVKPDFRDMTIGFRCVEVGPGG